MDKELDKCGCGCGCGSHEHEHHHEHEGCGCGCGHDHDHEESFVIDLEDDNGNVVSCPIIDAFEYEESEYVLAQNPEDESVYMFKSVGEELVVPDEEEFNRVATYYNEELVEK
ncbi:DUF1292 domain-containing protein [uncultured Clostridium sp.]|uniref:DUF1292 domain-containing protein n=1 Tax=uncultured Clostridium sp. TaxID=59620 RepID=UPI0025E0D1A2|nr:DUF1292 domain-containing protein [uncultured Clostridium sp.]